MSSSTTKNIDPGSIGECLFGADKFQNGTDSRVTSPPSEQSSIDPSARPSKVISPSGLDAELYQGRWGDSVERKEPQHHVIDLPRLRRITSQGVVDKGSHRAVAWRVLLGYLPPDTEKWNDLLIRERKLYRTLVKELFVETSDVDGSDLRGHHSKQGCDQMEKERKEELNNLTPTTTPEKTADNHEKLFPTNHSIKRRNSIGYAPTFKPSLPRRKSLGDMPTDESPLGDTVSELSNRTRELYITNDRVMDRSERTRSFLKTIGMGDLMDAYRKEAAEKDDNNDDEDSATEAHGEQPEMIIPASIKEQWKKSGRDTDALSGMTGSMKGLNTLLVVEEQDRYAPSRSNRESNNGDDAVESQAKWQFFYENAVLLDEIRKDIVRTHPDLFFFLEPKQNLGQRRYAAIERILFVWAKLNKGVRYVQGMNEIVATIYYVLANDFNEEWACHAEADTYFLFNILMVEMRDVFVPDLDEADTGIQGRISNVVSLLSLHDPEVSAHLNDCGIDASFYAIRWLTTLLSREFLLPDTIRLWDSMFASTHKENFLRYVCVTMVMVVRKELLTGDFSKCLKMLQSYPSTNVDDLLEASRALWIFESQVTLVCHKGGISLQKALASIAPPPAIIMAYGLPGGVTFKHSDREENGPKTPSRPTSNRKSQGGNNNNFGAQAAGFMSQARGYLERRYRKAKSNV